MAKPIIPAFVDNSSQLDKAKKADQRAQHQVNTQINNWENKSIAEAVLNGLNINANFNSPQVANQVDNVTSAPNGFSGLTWQNMPNPAIPIIPGLLSVQAPSYSVIPGVTLGAGFLSCTGVSNICNPVKPDFFIANPTNPRKNKQLNNACLDALTKQSCKELSHFALTSIGVTLPLQSCRSSVAGMTSAESKDVPIAYVEHTNAINACVMCYDIPNQIISGSATDTSYTIPSIGGNRGISDITMRLSTLLSNIQPGNPNSCTSDVSSRYNGTPNIPYCTPFASERYLPQITYASSMACIDAGPARTYTGRNNDNLLFLNNPVGRGFVGPGQSDKVNMLTVLGSDQVGFNASQLNQYNNYNTDHDDIIAFYFHDLANDRYIPFRATIKGIQEQAMSEWNDISYSGRADKLYNYKGFTRTLNFGFVAIAGSLLELLPMWQRINYLMTTVKPSNYTSVTGINNVSSNYIIPPMMTITIGDMYKEQPIVIDNVGISIPDEAQWETLSENQSNDKLWTYFNQTIQIQESRKKSAQFPKICEITITAKILEQMRPQMGQHNFGTYYSGSCDTFSGQLIVGNNIPTGVTPTVSSTEQTYSEPENQSTNQFNGGF